MTSEGATEKELSPLDLVFHIARWRWTILAFLLLGIALSIPAAYYYARHSAKVITLKIYATGTPTDSQGQVADQLNASLVTAGFVAAPGRDSSTFTVRLPYTQGQESLADAKLEKVEAAIAAFEQRLDAKVETVFSSVQDRLKSMEPAGNVDIFLRFNSYLIGRKEGMINPVRITVNDKHPAKWAAPLIVALISLATAGIGILVSLALASHRSGNNRAA